jgi:hypothetical protein
MSASIAVASSIARNLASGDIPCKGFLAVL